MLEDEYLVAHNHAHEGDEAKHAREAQHLVGNEQAYDGTRHAQADGHDAHDGYGELAEVEQQEEEDEHHGHANAYHDVGRYLAVLLRLSAHLGTHTLRQVHVVDVVDEMVLYAQGEGATLALGGDRDAALAIAVHYLCLAPHGLHLSHLAQCHGRGGGGGQVGVLHIAQLHGILLAVLHYDGHLVGTALAVHIASLPDAAHLHLARLEHQLQFGRSACDAHLRRRHGVEAHLHHGRRHVEIRVHPLQFGDASHLLHEHLCRLLYGIRVVAIETVFIGRHGQVVHLLPAHIGIGPVVGVFRCQLVEKFQRSLVALGVHYELGKVLAGNNRSIAGVEARRGATHETRHTSHLVAGLQYGAKFVGNEPCLLQAATLGQVHLHGKLVAVGIGELAHLEQGEQGTCGDNQHYASHYGEPGMAEVPLQSLVVPVLHPVG